MLFVRVQIVGFRIMLLQGATISAVPHFQYDRIIPITMRIGRTKTTMRTNVILTTMNIGKAGEKMTIK